MSFADKIHSRCVVINSCLVAGIDPEIESMPAFLVNEAAQSSDSTDEAVYYLLSRSNTLVLQTLSQSVAAIKPNLAFFEQYGISGMRAFARLCHEARDLGMPVIADAKRGDISNTARAYSRAFLGQTSCFGKKQAGFNVDAVTIAPFMGFSSIEPYLSDCEEFDKGIFVLVRTSNPDAEMIQGVTQDGLSVSERVARWIETHADRLLGRHGTSGLGAVVGATKPEVAKELRKIMPRSIFLIPGLGAQGASAEQALAGFIPATQDAQPIFSGGLVDVSRGLLGSFSPDIQTEEQLKLELLSRADKLNSSLRLALKERQNH